jgi:hypothetical protein
MTEQAKTFEPISTQEEFDERIKARLAREREKWEKESDTEDLRAQLEAKDEEISQIRREHYRADVRRAVVDELVASGVTERGAWSASSGTWTSMPSNPPRMEVPTSEASEGNSPTSHATCPNS